MKAIEIFKTGKHTDMGGTSLEFSEADLQAAVEAYDPALHEAPVVVGHPKDNLPAYGWVQSLSFSEGGVLMAALDQVDASFAELVNAGRFKKVSAAFYLPDSPSNPKPGAYYLRHVGFLGAQPPAVKGLKSASFADAEEGVVEFADWGHRSSANLFRRVRDFFIEKFGLETADAVLPDWEINSLQEAARPAEPSVHPSFSEPAPKETTPVKTPEQIAAEAAELQRQRDELQAREATVAAREQAARRAGLAAFAEGLVKEGRVHPKHKDGLVALMASLPDGGMVEFGEGDAKQSTPSIDWLKSFVAELPKLVEFSEAAPPSKAVQQIDNTDPQEIAKAAVEFQEAEAKQGRQVSIATAVQHVTKQGATK